MAKSSNCWGDACICVPPTKIFSIIAAPGSDGDLGCARVIWSGPPVSPVAKRHQAAVRVCGQEGSWFATSRGTRQGDPISPTVFIADRERAMDKVKDGEEGILVHGIRINNLRFADDIDLSLIHI